MKIFRISVGYSFMKQTGFRINAVTITANNCIIYYLVNTGGLTFPRLTWPDTCRGTRARCWRWPARTARPPRRWASSPSPAGPAPRRPSRTCRWAWHRVGGAALCWLAPRHPTTDTHPPRSLLPTTVHHLSVDTSTESWHSIFPIFQNLMPDI